MHEKAGKAIDLLSSCDEETAVVICNQETNVLNDSCGIGEQRWA